MGKLTPWACCGTTIFVCNGWHKSGWADAKNCSLRVHGHVDAMGMWNGRENSIRANAKKFSLRVHGEIDAMGMVWGDEICVELVGEKWVGQCQKVFLESPWQDQRNGHAMK